VRIIRFAIPALAGLLLLVALVVKRSASTRDAFARAVAAADFPKGRGDELVVTEWDLMLLPVPAQRYLQFMGVVGRCRDWSFRAHMTGSFRTSPAQAWSEMEAWQYDNRLEIGRLFYLNVRLFGFLPVVGRDTYLRGEGRMLIRPLDLFAVDDVKGDEVEISELVTYLNDAILLAPSFLLGSETTWSAAGPDAFNVALTYAGHTVTAQVSLDERGAPRDFSTTDRFVRDPIDPKHELVRARWTTPIDGWQMVDGRPIPTSGRAVWHLPHGDFTYVAMRFDRNEIAFNVPGALVPYSQSCF